MRAAPAMRLNLGDFTHPLLISRNPRAVFWTFVLCHGIVWTLTPALSLPNGLLDTMEMLSWGSHWQWGYEKHPPLAAWIAEAFAQMTGKALWGVYLAGQLVILACFWAVWRVARDLVGHEYAVLSVLVLEGISYYSYETPAFNHNLVQLALWALTVLCLWLSLSSGRIRYWLLCGVMIGLGFLNKYDMIVLLVPFLVLMLLHAQARKQFGTPGPYVAVVVAAVIVAPHVYWLFKNDFPTVPYALARGKGTGRLLDHLVSPLTFGLRQALELVPAIIMVGLLRLGSISNRGGAAPGGFPRAFLFTAALGPFLAYIVVSAIMGFRLHIKWGTPLWSFIGVFLLFSVRPSLTEKALKRFRYAFMGFAAAWVIAFVGKFAFVPALTGHVSRGHLPGQAIADYMTTQWVRRYGTPLPIVGGDKWLAENIGFYSPDRPDVYADLDPKKSPWANDEAFKQRGGVIIWDAVKDGYAFPDPWRTRFPGALVQPAAHFGWQTSAIVPPVQIGWAFVASAPSPSRPQ